MPKTDTSGALSYVVSIAGLGKLGVTSVTPLALTEGPPGNQPSVSRFVDAYANVIVPGSIRIGGSSCSPLKGSPRHSTLNFRLIADDSTYPEIGRFFARRADSHVAELDAILTPTTIVPTILLGTMVPSGIVATDIVYMEREAMRVDSVLTTETFLIESDIPDPASPGSFVNRSISGTEGAEGHIGTYIRTHSPRGLLPLYADARVYLAPPFIKGLDVVLYTTNGVTTEVVIGRYVVESVSWRAGFAEVDVTCRDLLYPLEQQSFSADPIIQSVGATGVVPAAGSPENVFFMLETPASEDAFADGGQSIYSGGAGVLQIGKSALVSNGGFVDGTRYFAAQPGEPRGAVFSPIPRFGSELLPDAVAKKPAREVLVTHPDIFLDPTLHPYYVPGGEIIAGVPGVARNVLDLVRCHLGTIDSNLPSDWRLYDSTAVAAHFVDDAGIVQLRDLVYPSIDWPGVIAGGDGKPIKALDWITKKFLLPLSMGFAVTSGGQLTIRTLRDAGGDGGATINATLILPGGTTGEIDEESEVDVVNAESAVGIDGIARLKIKALSAIRQRMHPHQRSQVDLDAGGLVSADDFDVRGRLGVVEYEGQIGLLQQLLRRAPMIVTMEITTATVVEPGTRRNFSLRQIRDPATGLALTDPASSPVDVTGFILRVDPRASERGLLGAMQRIEVLVFPFVTRRISTSATITAITVHVTDTDVDIEATDWIIAAPYAGGPAPVSTDADTFVVGEVCVVRDERGVVLSDPWTVTAIGVNQLTGEDLAAPGTPIQTVGGGGDLGSGAIVTLADFGSSRSEETDVYAWFGQSEYVL